MQIMLQESARYLFYAPFYAALALRAYEKEGLDVRFVPSATAAYGADSVIGGAADVAWGGPSRLLANYDKDPASPLVAFCEVVTRDPFFLVGRTPRPDMTLRDLQSVRLATVSEVPTPWHCLQEDLRRVGIDPQTLDRKSDGAMPANMAALRAGAMDVVQLFEPYVSEIVRAGDAFVWYAGASRGPTSFTTLYAPRAAVARRRDEFKGMVRAIYRVQRWMREASTGEIASAIADYFPHLSSEIAAMAIERQRDAGIWGSDPRLPRSGFDRLKASFRSGGYITRDLPFEAAVDNSLAEEVMAEG